MDDGLILTLGSGTLGALITLGGQWLHGRYTKVPQPLTVTPLPMHPDREDYNAAQANQFARLSNLEQRVSKIEGIVEGQTAALCRIENKLDKILIK